MGKLFIVAAIFALAIAFANPSVAASFDCTKASTLVEKAICDDADLSKKDEALAYAYRALLRTGGDQVREDQRRWIATRDQCRDVGCLRTAYNSRLRQLASRLPGYSFGVFEARDGVLDLVQIDADTFAFGLVATWRDHTGTLDGQFQVFGDTGKYVASDCGIVFDRRNGGWTLRQIGGCGFGLNVIVDGDYRLRVGESPDLTPF